MSSRHQRTLIVTSNAGTLGHSCALQCMLSECTKLTEQHPCTASIGYIFTFSLHLMPVQVLSSCLAITQVEGRSVNIQLLKLTGAWQQTPHFFECRLGPSSCLPISAPYVIASEFTQGCTSFCRVAVCLLWRSTQVRCVWRGGMLGSFEAQLLFSKVKSMLVLVCCCCCSPHRCAACGAAGC
jgi:hypothetical protein